MKKLIVTGANGFVAGSVLTQTGDDWQVLFPISGLVRHLLLQMAQSHLRGLARRHVELTLQGGDWVAAKLDDETALTRW